MEASSTEGGDDNLVKNGRVTRVEILQLMTEWRTGELVGRR